MASLQDSVMQNSGTQKVAVSSASAATAARVYGDGVYAIVEIFGSCAFHMKEGSAPVATTNDAPYQGGQVITKKINSGSKLAFIKQSGEADGNVWVTKVV